MLTLAKDGKEAADFPLMEVGAHRQRNHQTVLLMITRAIQRWHQEDGQIRAFALNTQVADASVKESYDEQGQGRANRLS